MPLFAHIPHPHVHHRNRIPPTVADQLDRSNPVARFNAAFAVGVTKAVGSMWCAYIFAIIAFVGLPSALTQGTLAIVQWIAQTFFQLVLLSVILVGQNVQAKASDKRALDTYNDAEAILHEAQQLQAHLAEQDTILTAALAHLKRQEPLL